MMKNKIQDLYALEQLAGGSTSIHRLHPAAKLFITVVFILTVVSYDRYAFGRLIPYVFYPTLLMAFAEIPYFQMLKKLLLALPFCFFAGITGLIFDRADAFTIAGITFSYGFISFSTVLFRAYLCIMAVLLLMAVTPLAELTSVLRQLRVPYIFVVMFEMTYRYIGVLFDEAYAMYTAYSLRSAERRGIKLKDMGSFIGQLLLRSFDRAERIYNAMKCRGYALHQLSYRRRSWSGREVTACFLCSLFFLLFRLFNINTIFIKMLEELS